MKRLPTDEYERELRAMGCRRLLELTKWGGAHWRGRLSPLLFQLPEDCKIVRIRDSKIIPEGEREDLYEQICGCAVSWEVGIVDNSEIDPHQHSARNICRNESRRSGLSKVPDFALIDGRDAPEVGVPSRALIKGDSLSRSIAAASIVAKVTRDRIMRMEHQRFPVYRFAENKGYGTAVHRAAVQEHGPCSLHRMSFLGSILQQRLSL